MEQVFKSEYLEGRRHNPTLYERLIESIKINCEKVLKENPQLTFKITMSAKFQTPRIVITENDSFPKNVESFEDRIIQAIEKTGFQYEDSEEKDSYYIINFSD